MGMSWLWLDSDSFSLSAEMMVRRLPFEPSRSCGFNVILYSQANFLAGKHPLADVWALDTAAKPYEWRKLEPEGDGPPPCM